MPIPLLAAAGIAAGAGFLNNLLRSSSQSSANSANINNQWQLYRAQNQRQDYLNNYGDLIKRNSLIRAGMSPASDFGAAPNLVGATPTKSDVQPVEPYTIDPSLLSLLFNVDKIKADTRKVNADAEAQEIENARSHDEDSSYNAFLHSLYEENDTDGFTNVLPDASVTSSRKFSKGSFDAKRSQRQYNSEVRELDMQDARNALDKVVYDERLKDKDVIKSIVDLPHSQYLQLEKEILKISQDTSTSASLKSLYESQKDLTDANKDYVKLKKEIEESSSLGPLIKKIASGNVSAEDVVRVILLSALQMVHATVSIKP